MTLRGVYEQGGEVWVQAGAGMNEKSEPANELKETNRKMEAMMPYVVMV